jgi:hypothetical protein
LVAGRRKKEKDLIAPIIFKPTFRTTELYYNRLQDNIYLIYV